MSKFSITSFWASNLNEARNSFGAMFRFHYIGTLLTIAVIAVTMAIPSIFYLLVRNVSVLTEDLTLGRNITVYLNNEIDPLRAAQIKDDLARDSRIASAYLITNSEALKDFSEALGVEENKILGGDNNPLPHAIVLTPNPSLDEGTSLEELVKEIEKNKAVELVRLDKQWFNRLNSMISLMNYLTIMIGIILLVSLLLTVLNTISNRVLLHKDEIEVMKLVGATNSYICRPYIYLGMWFGFLGAAVAWWLTSVALYTVNAYVNAIAKAYNTSFSIKSFTFTELLTLILVSVVLSVIVSVFTAKTTIAKIEPK
jgi:cell division transport system permease protein